MQPSTETVQEIWEIAHKIIGETFLHFSPADQLVVEERTHRLKLTYVSARMSPDPQDITQVNLSFDFDTCELWISWLSVSTQLRLSGVGSQLVNVAETIARVIGIQIICVFPLVSTNTFWEKMGYVPYRRATRVLCKQLNLSPSTRADVASDRRCTCQGNGRTKWVSSADSTLLLP